MSSLLSIINQPIVIIGGVALVAAAGVILYLRSKGELGSPAGKSSGPSKKYVILLRPKDHRMKFIKIVDESDESLQGPKEKTGRTRYFVKKEAGWADEDHPQTMWLGLNAYAYTLKLQAIAEAQKVLKLADAVRIVLGPQVYDVIQPDLRTKLEEAELGLTVETENPALTQGLSAGNESRHTESDEMMVDYYAKKNADAMKKKTDLMQILMGVSVGIVIGIALVSFKVIKLA